MQVEEKIQELYLTKQLSLNDNEVTDFPLNSSVQKSLNNIILREGFTSYRIFKRMISTNGGNFMGELYEIDIHGENKKGKKEINIFLKQMIPSESLNVLFNVNKCYLREVFMYSELQNIFNALQERADIPANERFKMVKSYNDSQDNAIVLENLSIKGFKTIHRMDVMTLKFAELSIIQLAKLHGLTFAMKYKNPEYFERKIKPMKSLLHFTEKWKEFVKRPIDLVCQYFDSDTREKIKRFQQILYEKMPKYFTGDTESIRCMCHGDFRPNNVLFKDNGKEEDDVFLIDYQLSFYGSPVIDLLYLIFTGSDRKFRKMHLNNLLKLYHDHLTGFLKHFNLDINNIYPHRVLIKDFEESLDFGLMVSLSILPLFFALEDDVPDFNKDNINDINFKLDNRFDDRITEIIQDFIDLGILI